MLKLVLAGLLAVTPIVAQAQSYNPNGGSSIGPGEMNPSAQRGGTTYGGGGVSFGGGYSQPYVVYRSDRPRDGELRILPDCSSVSYLRRERRWVQVSPPPPGGCSRGIVHTRDVVQTTDRPAPSGQ